jgi:hypothetical protein
MKATYDVMLWDLPNHGGRDSVAWAEITGFESPLGLRFSGNFRTVPEIHSGSDAIDTRSLSQG